MDDVPSRDLIRRSFPGLQDNRDEVTSRDLICRPLRALKDNRAEAEREAGLINGAHSEVPTVSYRPGVYLMMDWVACRLRKAGATVWAYIFATEEFEFFSAIEFECVCSIELESVAALSTFLV
jgi:hypothetical protein